MDNSKNDFTSDDINAYLNEIQILKSRISEMEENNCQTSNFLLEFIRRTLLSAASIRTAASSMLSGNFLWDKSSNWEFLEIIDDSIDNICDQLSLISILLRIQSNKIDMHKEYYPADELLSGTVNSIKKKLKTDFADVKLAESLGQFYADYNYLNMGFVLFFSALSDTNARVSVEGNEKDLNYELRITNCPMAELKLLENFTKGEDLPSDTVKDCTTNTNVKLFVSAKLLMLQDIGIKLIPENDGTVSVLMNLPINFDYQV